MENNFFTDDTIFILDSYGLIYREYFAFINRPLTNSKKENISAVFGFFRNLNLIIKNYKPNYMIAAMDSKTPTFRHELYSEYKATRQKTPDDLKAQFPWIEELLEKLGIPVVRCNGYEADDIVATIAKECEKTERHCCILSADKDLMQLTSDNVHILKPDKTKTWAELDKTKVEEEWGVPPEKLLDLLSLIGDTADNVPGVKGIGPKTAVKLLTEYKTLEGIYEHSSEIKGSIGEKIRTDKENAFFSKKLITLNSEVPCIKDLNKFSIKELNINSFSQEMIKWELPAIAKLYKELTNSDKDISQQNPNIALTEDINTNTPQIKKNKGNYIGCTTIEELKSYIDKALLKENLIIAFDTETDSLITTEANLVGFSLSYEAGTGLYVPLILTESLFAPTIQKKDALDQLKRLFEDKNTTIVMHNAKFDLQVLACNGFAQSEKSKNQIFNLKERLFDTMIAAWLLEPDKLGRTPYSLEFLAETKLGLKGIEYSEIVSKDKTFADIPLEQAVEYGAEDADFTLQLYNYFSKKLNEENLLNLYRNMEIQILPILAQMELDGIHLNPSYLEQYSLELKCKLNSLEKEIYNVVGHEFNISSPKQLSQVLFEERGLKGTKKTKTGFSTDTDVLESLKAYDIVPEMILNYRAVSKLLSTYVETLPKIIDEECRIHTTFMQTGTSTGRLSSKDPNLQNIPIRTEEGRKIRKAFTASQGNVLISADYAQIELVILAHLSGDKNLCDAFNSSVDVHKATAALIYKTTPENVTPDMRRNAKTLNFGLMYGMSAFRLANELKISRTQAQQFIEEYFNIYSGVKQFFDDSIKQAEEKGFIQTINGRKRYIPSINSKNKMEKEAAIRIAKNSPIQGSAADIVKQAMIDIDSALKTINNGTKLILQVHDELIFECPNNEKTITETISLIKEKMENTIKLKVPLRVSIEYGENWGEFH